MLHLSLQWVFSMLPLTTVKATIATHFFKQLTVVHVCFRKMLPPSDIKLFIVPVLNYMYHLSNGTNNHDFYNFFV